MPHILNRALRPGPARLALATAFLLLLALPVAAQSVSINLGGGGASAAASGGQSLTTNLVALLVGSTLLAIAPGLVVVATAFTRIVVVLSMLRTAIGLQQSPPNTVLVSLALFLTAFVMAPVLQTVWRDAAQPLMEGTIVEEQAAERALLPFRGFMEANVRERELNLFAEIAHWRPPAAAEGESTAAAATPAAPSAARPGLSRQDRAAVPLHVLAAAFLTSELSKAFQIGFLLFLPFLAIDIAISAVLMGMGMMMLPPVTISLPFKLIFFVLVDGWSLVAGALVRGFTT